MDAPPAHHGNNVLSAHRASKVFWVRGAKHPFHVIKGVSLSVKAGEMLAVVGPSGSGKSTLLRCLAGLEPLTEGHVTLLDANLGRATRADIAELLRDPVGVLLPTPLLVPSLTVRQNVELPGLIAARSGLSTRELAQATLAELGIEHLVGHLPDQLTPAQATLVALARVVSQNPRIIFADEPTGRLNVPESKVVIQRLNQLRSQGTAIVLATHDLHLAALASRVMILVDGQAQELLEEPTADEVLAALGRATGDLLHEVTASSAKDTATAPEAAAVDLAGTPSTTSSSEPTPKSKPPAEDHTSTAPSDAAPDDPAQVDTAPTAQPKPTKGKGRIWRRGKGRP